MEDNRRLVHHSYGLAMKVITTGQLGEFSIYDLLLAFCVIVNLYMGIHLFTTVILVRLYKYIPCLRHVYILYHFYSKEVTPTEEEAWNAVNDEDDITVKELEDLGKNARMRFYGGAQENE